MEPKRDFFYFKANDTILRFDKETDMSFGDDEGDVPESNYSVDKKTPTQITKIYYDFLTPIDKNLGKMQVLVSTRGTSSDYESFIRFFKSEGIKIENLPEEGGLIKHNDVFFIINDPNLKDSKGFPLGFRCNDRSTFPTSIFGLRNCSHSFYWQDLLVLGRLVWLEEITKETLLELHHEVLNDLNNKLITAPDEIAA